ncbi:MAG TPA: hypothetical protein VFQ46_02635, partial [Candidatus Limnocylindria bacterium]|nr:hypothetical protein [Candidatus Limnocylindria bacterium]
IGRGGVTGKLTVELDLEPDMSAQSFAVRTIRLAFQQRSPSSEGRSPDIASRPSSSRQSAPVYARASCSASVGLTSTWMRASSRSGTPSIVEPVS